MHNDQGVVSRSFTFIKSIFLRGFFTLIPIVITVTFLSFVFKLVKAWLEPVYNLEPAFLRAIPQSEFIFTLFIILALGTLLKYFFLDTFIQRVENSILNRIPLLRQVYFGVKQLIHAFKAEDKFTFKTVVMIEYPRKGVFSIAFLTGEAHPQSFPGMEGKFFSVFLPTTPNPTTGTCILVREDELHPINISRQDAMALIISGGIIHPEEK